LALDHRNLRDDGYKTIRKLLLDRGYEEGEQPFVFERKIEGKEFVVEVDFLAGEYGGTGKGHRHQKISKQNMRPRKARGCDLVFDNPEQMTIEAELPSGAKDAVNLRIASIVPFLIIKAMALRDRIKEKDAWDNILLHSELSRWD
jgi:hypothetical protein